MANRLLTESCLHDMQTGHIPLISLNDYSKDSSSYTAIDATVMILQLYLESRNIMKFQ